MWSSLRERLHAPGRRRFFRVEYQLRIIVVLAICLMFVSHQRLHPWSHVTSKDAAEQESFAFGPTVVVSDTTAKKNRWQNKKQRITSENRPDATFSKSKNTIKPTNTQDTKAKMKEGPSQKVIAGSKQESKMPSVPALTVPSSVVTSSVKKEGETKNNDLGSINSRKANMGRNITHYNINQTITPVDDTTMKMLAMNITQQQPSRLDIATSDATSNGAMLDNNNNNNNNNSIISYARVKTMFEYTKEAWRLNRTTNTVLSVLPPPLKIYVYEPTQLQPSPEMAGIHSCGIQEVLKMPHSSQWNFHADLALINLFETYEGRTYNATEAELFVVPYPHATHCLLGPCRPKQPPQTEEQGPTTSANISNNKTKGIRYGLHCPIVSDQTMSKFMYGLEHLRGHPQRWDRHLFILSGDSGLLKPVLERMPLILTIGYQQLFGGDKPKKKDKVLRKYNPTRRRSGQILIPYLNDHPWFQPSAILSRPNEWWMTRPRTYSFVYFYGSSNKKARGKKANNDSRRFRREFAESVQANYPNGTLFGGRPYILQELGNGQPKPSPEQVYKLYQESILCPCLPGDSPIQKRFFDVLMSGCLPVVLRFPPTRPGSSANDTYWHPWEKDIRRVYPYSAPKVEQQQRPDSNATITATFSSNQPGGAAMRIDYESFVIQADVPLTNGTIERAMEAILSNQQELAKRQSLLQKYAPFFTYGMGPDAHLYPDAFSQIVRLLKSHVQQLDQELKQHGGGTKV